MRYYALTLTNIASGAVYQIGSNGGLTQTPGATATFTSLTPAGVNDPGALNIEFDMPVSPYNAPQGQALIRVWGVGLRALGQQAADLNQVNGQPVVSFTLQAGMTKGLPLATAASVQKGIILQGAVYQAFGNWQGTSQTLEIIVQNAGLMPKGGVMFVWNPGQPLSAALATTFAQAFPDYTPDVSNLLPSLYPPNNSTNYKGTYPSLTAFARALQEITQPLGAAATEDGNYPGVQIGITGSTISAYDNTSPPAAKLLEFRDLIGQPTWIDAGTINFKTVLRSDFALRSQVRFPKGIYAPYALTNPDAAVPGTPASQSSIFQNAFTISEVHHFANFRQADADSWATTFQATPVLATAAAS